MLSHNIHAEKENKCEASKRARSLTLTKHLHKVMPVKYFLWKKRKTEQSVETVHSHMNADLCTYKNPSMNILTYRKSAS